MCDDVAYEIRLRLQSHLVEESRSVRAHCLRTDVKVSPNILYGHSASKRTKHLELPVAEQLVRRARSPAVDESRQLFCQSVTDVLASAGNPPNRQHELFGRMILRQISCSTCAQRAQRPLIFRMDAEDENSYGRMPLPQLHQRLYERRTWHAHIEKHYI